METPPSLNPYLDRVAADLEAKGFSPAMIAILVELLGPFVIDLFKRCASKRNPQILRRRSLSAQERTQAGGSYRTRLRKRLAKLPAGMTADDRETLAGVLVSRGAQTPAAEYVAVAAEITDWTIEED